MLAAQHNVRHFDRPGKEWFAQAKFGMFIHWGVYSSLGGEWRNTRNSPTIWGYDAWIQLFADISAEDYLYAARKFNPAKFNAAAIVAIAKDAGMKYLVITTKHHDGFCMYDSKLTRFDIMDVTPFKRDPVKELADECKKQGIKFCVYYSIPDWNHQELPARLNTYHYHSRPKADARPELYINYVCGQLKELITKYRPEMIWFDRGDELTFYEAGKTYPQAVNARKIINTIKELNPDILINNRLDTAADFITPEQVIPGKAGGKYFESCMTMGKAWGYTTYDTVKPLNDFLFNICDVAAKGGNYLLNISPTGSGEVPAAQVERLAEIGTWMRRNGECIYNTNGSPWAEQPEWGRITRKGNTLYVIVMRQPAIGFAILNNINEMPVRVRQLDNTLPVFNLHPRILNNGLWMLVQEDFIQKQPVVFALDFKPGVLDKI